MSPESSSPIFIHSLWRAGSTYLFQVFRRSEAGYYCYQEPLHEIALFNKDAPEKLLEYSGDLMQPLRHPVLSRPYYQELYDTNRFWKDKLVKSDIYDAYFSSEFSETLGSFLKALIEHAQGRTVIQECRTSNRIGVLKKTFGGTHLYLWRNPWDQWWSYKATDYFDMIQLLLVNAEDAPPVIKALRQKLHFKQYHGETLQDEMQFFSVSRLSAENSYSCFYMLWCLAFLEAQQHADFLLNIDQLSASSDYKTEFLEIMGGTGISGLDFSDCRIHCTQFTQQDATFFKPLEDMVHELLMQHLGSGQVDIVKEARERGIPDSQRILPESTAGNVVLEDARRTREVVIRLENTFHNLIKHQLYLREQLKGMYQNEINQQITKAEQHRSGSQLLFDDQSGQFLQYQACKEQAFKSLLIHQQLKAQSEAQLRIEQLAVLNKRHNQEISEFQKTAKQENDELVHNYTIQLETLQQRYTALKRELLQKQLEAQARNANNKEELSQCLQAIRQLGDLEKQKNSQQFAEQLLTAEQHYAAREKELLQEQLAMQVRSAEREREFSEQLKFADQEKQKLNQQFTEQLLTAAQQHATREKELLHEQLVMQARSTEREREVVEQLQSLHASYRQAEVAKEKHFQYLLNQISDEATVLYNSRWWRVGAFFSWLPKTGFERLLTLLTVKKQSLVTNNMPFSSSEFAHRDDTVVEEESLLEMDTIDQLLLSSETEFVTKAYQLILGRQADPTGIAHYRKWLRAGKSRVEILADLLASREAQLASRPGLDELRVLISQTGAGLKGWRKWLALPRIMNHRMTILERQLTTLQASSREMSAQNRVEVLPMILEALTRIERRLIREDQKFQQEKPKECFEVSTPSENDITFGSVAPNSSNFIFVTGERKMLAVDVKNGSNIVWESTENQPIFLSYRWYSENGDLFSDNGLRTTFSESVTPGESRRLLLAVLAPKKSGNYLLEVTMVMEGKFWFDKRGLQVSRVPVQVNRTMQPPHASRIYKDLLAALAMQKNGAI